MQWEMDRENPEVQRDIGQAKGSNKTMLNTSTRDALAEYFLDKKVVPLPQN